MKTAKVFRQIGRHLVLLFLGLPVAGAHPVAGGDLLWRGQGAEPLHLLPLGLYPGPLQGHPASRVRLGEPVPPVVHEHLYHRHFYLHHFQYVCADGGLRHELHALQGPQAPDEHRHYHEPVPGLPVHDRGVLHHEKPESDQLHDGHGHCVFRGGGAGILDCQGIF